jgi:hypothetical protein
VYKILKHISKDIKETVKIHENINENMFLQPYEKLRNTTNINLKKIEWNFYNHTDSLVTSDKLEKASKLMKNGTSPGEDNNSELYKYVGEEFKLILLQFFNKKKTKKSYSK